MGEYINPSDDEWAVQTNQQTQKSELTNQRDTASQSQKLLFSLYLCLFFHFSSSLSLQNFSQFLIASKFVVRRNLCSSEMTIHGSLRIFYSEVLGQVRSSSHDSRPYNMLTGRKHNNFYIAHLLEAAKAEAPDSTFHNIRAPKYVDRRFRTTYILLVCQFWGSRIAKRSVRMW